MIGKLEQLIDESLNFLVAEKGNCLPEVPPKDMAMEKEAEDDDWYFWQPIPSSVTNQEITELEKYINVCFPEQYKRLLKHKHFLELICGEVSFIAHPSFGWQTRITDMILAFDTKEMTFDRGYLPFASYSDWGLWCFGLKDRSIENECPIYLWDCERSEYFEFVANNPEDALIEELKTSRIHNRDY